MKKYLMTGVAALAICAAFTSCSKSDELYDQGAIDQGKALSVVETYNQAFLKYIGANSVADIPSNQTWGFGGYSASAGTRGANTEGNIWFKTWERPYNVNLSAAELAELKGLFEKGVPTTNTEIFPYENYYVEQIYKGESSDVAYDKDNKPTNTSVTGSNQMDHLQARDGSNYTHINNFNYGKNETQMVDEGNGTRYIGITLMENMSLNGITANNQFGYSESWGTKNNKFYNNYIMVQYKGEWYVGFDFEAHKDVNNPNEARDVNRDWNFTDWIVRISPAVHKVVDPDNVCIIAEDLSAATATDFDFNDVVFTVEYTSNSSATITLYAAGGTLPLKVAGEEVHAKFGFPTPDPTTGKYKMINTGAKADENGIPTVSWTVNNIDKSKRGNDIKIEVDKGEKNADGVHVPNWIELTATGGEPAAKLCVGTDFATDGKWCEERESIKTKYPTFSAWVLDNPTRIWWR
jgi:hypothetical protein